MNQVVTILYRPGAYGSFLAWALERFNAVRKKYEPAVTDNPLLPDGSSHGYVSHCKVRNIPNLIEDLNQARWDITPWHFKIHAAWPTGNVNDAIAAVQDWMYSHDKLIVVDVIDDREFALLYLRNEATLNADRWHCMLNISADDELVNALRRDIDEPLTDSDGYSDDRRIKFLPLWDIFNASAPTLFGLDLFGFLGWPSCDEKLFESRLNEMRELQEIYLKRIEELNDGAKPETPAEFAISEIFKENK